MKRWELSWTECKWTAIFSLNITDIVLILIIVHYIVVHESILVVMSLHVSVVVSSQFILDKAVLRDTKT